MKNCFIFIVFLLSSCAQDNKIIKIKGSDTEVNLSVQLAESFHRVNKGVIVSVSGGGSGLGIASLMNATADIANSSRKINNKELFLFREKNIQVDSFVFAQDAIAIVVAENNSLDSISTKDLAHILNGKYKNWSLLNGEEKPINIYGRQSNSGTYDFIKAKLGIAFTPYAKQMNGNAQILEAIKADNSGIGYVGAGYISHGENNKIKVLPVYHEKGESAISPLDSKMIKAGKYYFQRPLFQYYKAGSFEKIKPFIDFEKSEAGMKIIESSGYYPVNEN